MLSLELTSLYDVVVQSKASTKDTGPIELKFYKIYILVQNKRACFFFKNQLLSWPNLKNFQKLLSIVFLKPG